jgi:hypothetical protein
MIFNTTIYQDHHALKASASAGLGRVRIGLSVALRRPAAWQPPRADTHRCARAPPAIARALTGPATSDGHALTTCNSASIPAPPGPTRGRPACAVPGTRARGHRVCVGATGSLPSWPRPTGGACTPHGGGSPGAQRPPQASPSARDGPRSGDRTCAPMAGPAWGLCARCPWDHGPRSGAESARGGGRAPSPCPPSACGPLGRPPRPGGPHGASGPLGPLGHVSRASGALCAPSAPRPAGAAR